MGSLGEGCFTNCSRLNLTTCNPLQQPVEKVVTQVTYDPDGCYDPQEYLAVMNTGNRFQDYSDFIGYFMLLFGAFGIIGNSLSIIVLINKEKICFNYLLVGLNCCDTIHIVFAILDVVRNNHGDFYPDSLLSIFPYFHYPFYRLSLCVSIYLIVAITCERYMAVTRPQTRLNSSQMTRAVMYILPCILVAMFLNIGKFFEAETVSYCMDFTSCGCGYHEVTYVRPTQLRLSRNYIIFYSTWTWVTMTSIGPFTILSLLNFIIWRKLKLAKKTMVELSKSIHHPKNTLLKEKKTLKEKTCLSSTTILLCTVSMFLTCNLPRLTLSIYEAAMINQIIHCQSKHKGITPIWYVYAMASVQLLQVVYTSVNFVIYWFVGNFRETFLDLFCGSQGVVGRVCKTFYTSESDNNFPEETHIEMMSRQESSNTLSGFAYEKLIEPQKL